MQSTGLNGKITALQELEGLNRLLIYQKGEKCSNLVFTSFTVYAFFGLISTLKRQMANSDMLQPSGSPFSISRLQLTVWPTSVDQSADYC